MVLVVVRQEGGVLGLYEYEKFAAGRFHGHGEALFTQTTYIIFLEAWRGAQIMLQCSEEDNVGQP